jgi:predicted alpha/beta hydrolase family esterase
MILNAPGLWNSGPEHWQTYWERVLPDCVRVQQRDWEAPVCEEWVKTLDAAVRAAQAPVVVTAHSSACAMVAHWAGKYGGRGIAGALLVGPSDVEGPIYPKEPKGFSPMPLKRLPFASIVVASEDDKWVSLERAKFFADAWGSRFVNIGRAGHINSDSRMGEWPEGQKLLRELLAGNAASNSSK